MFVVRVGPVDIAHDPEEMLKSCHHIRKVVGFRVKNKVVEKCVGFDTSDDSVEFGMKSAEK